MYIVIATDVSGRKYLGGTYDVLADANARLAAIKLLDPKWTITESHQVTKFDPAVLLPLEASPLSR